jgi:hypothetical protein
LIMSYCNRGKIIQDAWSDEREINVIIDFSISNGHPLLLWWKKYDVVHYLKKACMIQRLTQTLWHVKFKCIGQLVYNKWKVQASCGGHGKIINFWSFGLKPQNQNPSFKNWYC